MVRTVFVFWLVLVGMLFGAANSPLTYEELCAEIDAYMAGDLDAANTIVCADAEDLAAFQLMLTKGDDTEDLAALLACLEDIKVINQTEGDETQSILTDILGVLEEPETRVDVEVVCDAVTNTWHYFTTTSVDGVPTGAPVQVDSGVPCELDEPDFELKTECREGTFWDVVYGFLPDGSFSEISAIDTGVPCEVKDFEQCFLPDQYAIVWAWNGSGDIMSYDPVAGLWTDYGSTVLPDGSVVGGFSMDVSNDATDPKIFFQVGGKLYSSPLDDPTTLTEIGPANNASFGGSYPCGAFDPSGRYLIGIGSGSTVGEVDVTTGAVTTVGTLIDVRDGAPLVAGPGDWFFDPAGNWFLMARDTRGATFGESTGTVLWKIDPATYQVTRVGNTPAPASGTGAAWLSAGQYLLSSGSSIYTYQANGDPVDPTPGAWVQNIPAAPHSINDLGNEWVIPEAITVVGCIVTLPDGSCELELKQLVSDPVTGESRAEVFVPTIAGTWGQCEAEPNPFVTDPFSSSSAGSDAKNPDEVWQEGCSDAGVTFWRRGCDSAGNTFEEFLYGSLTSPTAAKPGGFSYLPCGVAPASETTQWCNEDVTPNVAVFRKEFADGVVIWFDAGGPIPEPTDKTPGECQDIDPLLPVSEQVICFEGEVYVRRESETYTENAEGLPELSSFQIEYFNEGGALWDSGVLAAGSALPAGEPSGWYLGDCVPDVPDCVDTSYAGQLWRVEAGSVVEATVDWWSTPTFPAGQTSAPHDNVSNIFTVSADGQTLEHVNGAPAVTFTQPTGDVRTSNASFLTDVGAANTSETSGNDQLRVRGYVILNEPALLFDSNPNTGERGGIWLNRCCAGNLELLFEDTTDSAAADTSVFSGVRVPVGVHYFEAVTSDLSAWQGFELSASFDDGETVAPLEIRSSKPRYQCVSLLRCNATGELIDAQTGQTVTIGPDDLLCEPPACSAEASEESAGYEGPTAEDIALAMVIAERDSLEGKIVKFQGNAVQSLPVPAGQRGNLVSISDTGTGLVYFSIDGSAPANTPVGVQRGEVTGPYLAAPVRNIDLSQVRFDGSSAASDYTVYYECFN